MPTYTLDILSFVLGTLFGVILLIAVVLLLARNRW